jgi:K+-transporting ATPase ATPase B chain
MSNTKNTSLFQSELMNEALKQSFIKLNPKTMFRNPVMFTVWVGTLVMLFVACSTLFGVSDQGSFGYNITIFMVLFLTLLFANFAEAIAEARGKSTSR